jgi:hypothetical protein
MFDGRCASQSSSQDCNVGTSPRRLVLCAEFCFIEGLAAVHRAHNLMRELLQFNENLPTIYACCQEAQQTWPLVPRLGAWAGRQVHPLS